MSIPVFSFDNSYARLPEHFYARLAPTPVADPRIVRVNEDLARQLGLDPGALVSATGAAILAGNRIPDGAEPLAMAYAGYQFGGWVPQLGDGRAILLGEVVDRDGVRRDIQLKGSGPTPYSRNGDGRAALGPVLREYVVSEAMAALGIPATRALAAVTTGEPVMRDNILPGAVLARVSRSHVRVGTFQYFEGLRDAESLRVLADYVIGRHYPQVRASDNPYLSLLDAVIDAQAGLIAQWQAVGFIHGVMNTDNTSIAGETIDFGPCAFMDAWHPETVYSSIDRLGRYAYCNQPPIAQWNLAGLAQSLLPLFDDDPDRAVELAQGSINRFPEVFGAAHDDAFRRKLGLETERSEDAALVQDLLDRMADNQADFTLTFRRLCELSATGGGRDGPVRELFSDPEGFDEWAVRWRERIAAEERPDEARKAGMRTANPAYIPRNHLVEAVIRAAEDNGDFGPFQDLVDILANPYTDQPGNERYQRPPLPGQVVRETFCGT